MRTALLLVTCLILAAPALAADEIEAVPAAKDAPAPAVETPNEGTLAEALAEEKKEDYIEVTGTRTAERDPFELPMAVRTFPRETLEDAGRMVAMKAISRRDPAIWYDERTYSTTDPIIRGFAGWNLLTVIDGNTLSTLWGEGGFGSDDMYGKIDPETVESIEVLFGPQSRIYGSNALGAVIYVKTRDSMVDYTEQGFEWIGRFKTDTTSAASGFGTRIELSGATPHFKFLIGGSYRDFDDVEGGRGLGTLSPSSSEERNFDLAAEVRLTDTRHLRLTYQNVTRDPTFRYYRPTQDNRNERQAIALFYTDDGGDGVWRGMNARVYYQVKKDRRHFYSDETRTVLVKSGRAITKTWQSDVHVLLSPADGHVITAGLAFELDQGDSPDDEQFTITYPEKRRDAPLSEWWDYGAYVQYEGTIAGPFSLVGSLRYDYMLFETDVDEYYVPESGDAAADEVSHVSRAWSGGLGLVFRPTDELRLIASWARGFRQYAPNFGIRQLGDGVLIPGDLLDPTISDNFELGIKGRYSGLSFEAFVYYSLIQNWQGDLRSGTYQGQDWYDYNGDGVRGLNEGVVRQTEGGDAYVLGTELRASVRPHAFVRGIPANYSLWGGFAWNEGEVEATDSHPRDEPIRHTQPMRGLLGLRWDDVTNPKSGLYVELVADMVAGYDEIPSDRRDSDLAWRRDPQDGDSPMLRKGGGVPGYTLFHLYAGVNLCRNAKLKLGLENLTDRKYRAAHSRMDGPGIDFLATLEIVF